MESFLLLAFYFWLFASLFRALNFVTVKQEARSKWQVALIYSLK